MKICWLPVVTGTFMLYIYYSFFQFKSLFSTIARKIRDKTFVDPKLAKSRKRPLNDDDMDTTSDDSNKRQRKATGLEISEAERLQFEEEFRDFDFSDLSEQDQEMQEVALESAEAIEESIERSEFLRDVENVADKNITDDGHPIYVSC